jgi:hypothetical protein
VTSVLGPWRRVVDTARAGKPDPDSLRDLLDGVLLPTGAIASRPGSQMLAAHPGAPGEAQALACLELAGTTYTLAVVGGVLASYDWTLDTWTTRTHTGTTINVTGPVALVAFFDLLVVSDGVNRPWSTTIGSGTGTYLPISTAAWYGLPVVKDAKLFGIKADERRTIVWSEEADLTIGGEVGGYNNAWDLRQTSQSALVALRSSNTSLVYQREGATGQILGAVDVEFQTSGTHDDVAERGTLSPFGSVFTADGRLWAVDALGRPYRAASGSDVDDLWLACDATVATVERGRLYRAWGAYLPDTDTVAFALPRTAGGTANTDLLHFDRASGDYVGRWRIGSTAGDMACGALCTDDDGVSRLVVLSSAGTPTVVWRTAEADADATKALDVTGSGSALVPTRAVLAEAQSAGAEQVARVQWTAFIPETGDPTAGTIPPVLSSASAGTSMTYECEVPGRPFGSDPSDPRTITVGPAGRREIGLKRWGRWMRLALAAVSGSGSERFRVWRVTVLGSVRDAASRSR